jgi:hypothetical protein
LVLVLGVPWVGEGEGGEGEAAREREREGVEGVEGVEDVGGVSERGGRGMGTKPKGFERGTAGVDSRKASPKW